MNTRPAHNLLVLILLPILPVLLPLLLTCSIPNATQDLVNRDASKQPPKTIVALQEPAKNSTTQIDQSSQTNPSQRSDQSTDMDVVQQELVGLEDKKTELSSAIRSLEKDLKNKRKTFQAHQLSWSNKLYVIERRQAKKDQESQAIAEARAERVKREAMVTLNERLLEKYKMCDEEISALQAQESELRNKVESLTLEYNTKLASLQAEERAVCQKLESSSELLEKLDELRSREEDLASDVESFNEKKRHFLDQEFVFKKDKEKCDGRASDLSRREGVLERSEKEYKERVEGLNFCIKSIDKLSKEITSKAEDLQKREGIFQSKEDALETLTRSQDARVQDLDAREETLRVKEDALKGRVNQNQCVDDPAETKNAIEPISLLSSSRILLQRRDVLDDLPSSPPRDKCENSLG